jgi:hypothetical protein
MIETTQYLWGEPSRKRCKRFMMWFHRIPINFYNVKWNRPTSCHWWHQNNNYEKCTLYYMYRIIHHCTIHYKFSYRQFCSSCDWQRNLFLQAATVRHCVGLIVLCLIITCVAGIAEQTWITVDVALADCVSRDDFCSCEFKRYTWRFSLHNMIECTSMFEHHPNKSTVH